MMAVSNVRPADTTHWSSERVAAVAFGVYLAVALPVLVHLGSHYWFMGDEWAFFVGGSLAEPAGLFRSIQSHWSTLPILVYRALYTVFGLHSYLPFQLCVILLHLTLCYLLRSIMRRVGVGPWMATICAATYVLFGTAEMNILAGVQISQVGSLVLGFSHMILADHDGRIDRRDYLGLACGLGSIMSSGFGPPLVAIVGLAVFCRRGWRPAVFHTAPLAVAYIVWWMLNYTAPLGDRLYPSLPIVMRWILHSEAGVFLALGGNPVVAVALGALLVTGLTLAWRPLSVSELRQRAALPAAMLASVFFLQAVVSLERWFIGIEIARSGRYIAVYAALTLPALAVAADAVVRRWQWMLPIICALFLVGIVSNIAQFGSTSRTPQSFAKTRQTILDVAYSPLAAQAPADLVPYPNARFGADVDMAFLRKARDSGRLPAPTAITPARASAAELRLSVQELAGPIPAELTCTVHAAPVEHKPDAGELYGFTTPVLVSLGKTGAPVAYNFGWGLLPVLRILRPDLTLRFAPRPPATSFGLCVKDTGPAVQ